LVKSHTDSPFSPFATNKLFSLEVRTTSQAYPDHKSSTSETVVGYTIVGFSLFVTSITNGPALPYATYNLFSSELKAKL